MFEENKVEDVLEQLDVLMEGNSAEIESNPHAALKRFKQGGSTSVYPSNRRSSTMTTTRKTILGSITLLVALVLVASFPATRALASEFLGIFRVAKFAPISVSPQQLAFLEEVMENNEGLFPGEMVFDEDPEPGREFNTLSEAAAWYSEGSEYGAPIRTMDGASGIYGETGGEGTLTVNLENARKLLEAANIDPMLLPDSLDGQDVSATVNRTIIQEFDGVGFVQMQSPEINYPVGVNPAPIGEALLTLLGMESADAKRLSRNIDWATTLIMPIPTEFATFSEVQIDGTTGVAIEAIDGSGVTMMWQSGGMVHILTGDGLETDDLLDMVDEMYYFFE